MLWASLIASGIVLLIANVLAFKKNLGEASLAVLLCIGGGLLCGGPAIVLTCIMTGLGGSLLWFRGARPRSFLIYSLAAMAGSHLVLGLWLGQRRHARYEELLKSYPSQSMATRLAYEEKSRGIGSQRNALVEQPINAVAVSHLDELEMQVNENEDTGLRTFMLQRLHDEVVEDFIDSPGFGVTRRIRPRKEEIDLPEVPAIPFPPSEYDPETGGTDSDPIVKFDPAASSEINLPSEQNLWSLHRDSVVDFVNPKGFGYVKDREHVRGFQVHQFHSMPSLPESSRARWLIQRVELVSLLTHDEPVAYVSDHLPRMDELRAAPTRPLSDFEKQALQALKAGGDLKVQSSANRIQVLGSIRAVNQCLKCHDVTRGDLLGAFSYYLKRDSALGQNRE